jgi:hypothetical protein
MSGGELIGVHSTQRIAEHDCLLHAKMSEQRFQITEIVVTAIGFRMIGVAVSALVRRDDPPLGRQRLRQRLVGQSFHPVRVQRDKWPAYATVVEKRQGESIMLEAVPVHNHLPLPISRSTTIPK